MATGTCVFMKGLSPQDPRAGTSLPTSKARPSGSEQDPGTCRTWWKLLSPLMLGAGDRGRSERHGEHSLQPQASCPPAAAQSAKEEPGAGRRKTHRKEAEAGRSEGESEDTKPGKPWPVELHGHRSPVMGHRRAAEPWTRPLLSLGPQARGTDMQS